MMSLILSPNETASRRKWIREERISVLNLNIKCEVYSEIYDFKDQGRGHTQKWRSECNHYIDIRGNYEA